jgi:hypothetical protein
MIVHNGAPIELISFRKQERSAPAGPDPSLVQRVA